MSVTKIDPTLNEVFENYLHIKSSLKDSTLVNYRYSYNRYVKGSLGERKVTSLRYSDIVHLYSELVRSGLKPASVRNIHTILHPTLTLAVRDRIIEFNPSDGAAADLNRLNCDSPSKKHALTLSEQRLLTEFLKASPSYHHWLPLITFFLGTGCRMGEVIGLTWNDVDFTSDIISINHNTLYRPNENGEMKLRISTPKTASGTRTIPLFGEVKNVLLSLRSEQTVGSKKRDIVIDGFTDFIFLNRFGSIYLPMDINRAIKRIYTAANIFEAQRAKAENRSPVTLRPFSAHNLRHTFCTRLCEVESNLKLIMAIMGHSNIQTTMNIYNELQEEKRLSAFKELDGRIHIS